MKWSRYNFLFHSEKISYALFNSRMLSFSILDKKTYEILSAVKNDIHSVSSLLSQDEINRLKKKKVLVQDHEDDNYLGMLRYRKQLQSYTSKTLGMVVCPTLSCNFACPYCYEHNLPKSVMKPQTQQQMVDFINSHSFGKENITLNWHGGEPLVAFKTMQQIYSILEKQSKLPIGHSSMVSNGYLLTEEICKYLEEKKLDYIQITIDGNKNTHDKTRVLKNGGSSFNRIIENIDMATELMPNCRIGVRTNIGRDNMDEYVDLYRQLTRRWKGKNCTVYHAYVLDNGINTCKEKRCALEITTKEKNNFEVMLAKSGIRDKRSLFPKIDSGTYTCMDCDAFVTAPDGTLYKCWADVGIKERAIGSLASGVTNNKIVSQFMVGTDKFADTRCLNCGFLPICDGGCNLYRVGKIEKGIPYDVCNLDEQGLIHYLETYLETV